MSGTLPAGYALLPDAPLVPQIPADWQSGPAQAAPTMLPPGYAVLPDAPQHPTSGPSGDIWTDIPRRLGTAAVDAVTGLMSPIARASAGPTVSVGPNGLHLPAADAPLPTPQQQDAAVSGMRNTLFNTTGGTEYVPQTMGGRMGQSALSMAMLAPLGAAAGGAASIPEVAASVPPAAAGGALSQAGAELYPSHPAVGSLAGLLLGGEIGRQGGNMLTGGAPGAPSMETAQLAQSARSNYGIPIAAGQLSDSPVVRFLNSQLKKVPFSGMAATDEAQQTGFNRAVSQTFGENSPLITPDVLQAARTRIGGVYNGVAARTNIPASPQLLTDLQGVVDNARLNMSADSVEPVQRQAMNIIDTAANNNGILSGRQFKDLTAKGGPIDTLQGSTDSGLRQAGQQFDSILKQHLAANAAPDDVAALQQADTQWKALKTVEPLTLRADTVGGATPSTGDISPASLRGAVNKSYTNAAVAQPGDIPLNDLANIGQRFLKEPGDSNTAVREAINHGLGTAGGLAAGLITGHEAGLPLAASAAGTIGTLAAGRLAGAYLRSPGYADRLIGAGLNPNRVTFQPQSPLALALMPGVARPAAPATNTSSQPPQ